MYYRNILLDKKNEEVELSIAIEGEGLRLFIDCFHNFYVLAEVYSWFELYEENYGEIRSTHFTADKQGVTILSKYVKALSMAFEDFKVSIAIHSDSLNHIKGNHDIVSMDVFNDNISYKDDDCENELSLLSEMDANMHFKIGGMIYDTENVLRLINKGYVFSRLCLYEESKHLELIYVDVTKEDTVWETRCLRCDQIGLDVDFEKTEGLVCPNCSLDNPLGFDQRVVLKSNFPFPH